jgi:TolB-like protein
MIYRFAEFELDTGRFELRSNGVVRAVEPQVFALLSVLIENRSRVVTKDELIEKVWNGRFVSESAISSRVKSARQSIGDDGRAQTFIRTVHGTGFSFVGEVAAFPAVSFVGTRSSATEEPVRTSQPSIAVIPFDLVGATEPGFPIADALPHDLITDLSRLRWLSVIARGSSFRFRGADVNLDEVRNQLGVQYCLTGTVEISGKSMSVSVELNETRNRRIVWGDRYRGNIDSVHEIRDQIVKAVTSAVEVRIPSNEAQRALLGSPENLDAWAVYHLGIHHMYRFNKFDNELATGFFKRAISMEPGFARAYAGLSFTHFQSSFLRYENQTDAQSLAQHYASQCLERDPLDPFGNFTMGRAHWLRGDLEASVPWLERATALNPNYAQAKYSTGWAQALLGSAETSQANISAALVLSPLDPLVYGMLGVRALSFIVLDDTAQAADWAERAANSPGAHALIEMIAATAHALNGDEVRAHAWASSVHTRASHLDKTDFIRAFPFRDKPTRLRISNALEKLGL